MVHTTPIIKQIQQQHQKTPVQMQKLEALGTLAGGIAHELNNILFIIQGYTDLALLDLEKQKNPASKLAKVKSGCDRAASLINQILTFSGTSNQPRTPLVVEPILKQSIKFLKSVLPPTIIIDQHFHTNEQLKVSATPSEIQQVIVNICTNGAQAMKNDGCLSVILEECEIFPDQPSDYIDLPPGRYLKLMVGDSGTGIRDCDVSRIFEPFFTTRNVGDGLGLGLSVVYGIISDINGKIFINSSNCEGTEFTIFLPTITEDLSESKFTGPSIPLGSGEHILLVEDDPVVLDMMRSILETLNYTVTCCKSGLEAKKLFLQNQDSVDLLLTDQVMPGMSGETLSHALRLLEPDLPVILCSGFGEDILNEKNGHKHIDIVLSKPVLMENLSNALFSLLEHKPKL